MRERRVDDKVEFSEKEGEGCGGEGVEGVCGIEVLEIGAVDCGAEAVGEGGAS